MSVEDAAAEQVGRYRLLGRLGQGGMGVVHRAVDDTGREVALKLLRPELAENADFRRRLAREVETMRRVRSPYVAEVLDADVSADRPYVVTRFIDGYPLDDAVRATGPLSGGPLGRIAAGLADALIAVHQAGVVHRDLKPSNVMLVGGAPVVIDFGIAHAVDATRLTQTGMVVGTPGYMGPEIIDGGQPGPAVDIYGWAATVAFAATGRSPFGNGSLEAVLARILSGRPDLDGVPPRLEPVLRAALDRDPDRRPSAADLAVRVREADLGGTAPPAVTAVADPRPASPTAVPAAPARAAVRRRVPLGLYKLLAYLAIAAAAAACAVLPVLGTAAVVVAAWYLRAGDSAVRSGRVPVREGKDLLLAPLRAERTLARSAYLVLPSLIYAGLIVGILSVALLAQGGYGKPSSIPRLSAVAFGYLMLAAPREMTPRRQLVRLLSGLAPNWRTTVWAGLVLAGLAAVTAYAAWVYAPHWWPLTSLYQHPGKVVQLLTSLYQHPGKVVQLLWSLLRHG
jgi:hypothetical protein